ncbi:hypothetical protein L226DRAFT_525848 [Lentinus tigrinus ALCF2SS1-7]|uniref:DNA-directed RNA polymerase n=1 Tax=Lentinus tigrinus ALCF2SS1-6 TaxID=1328759 RepID=A0A5C2RQE7_9APHY|nr:hypothetical protein L227DRAFT_567773 [Lentinus tigrinus ALCF2SS1-6]RPD70548.1 hypothetical protein L226DRAFT_525848 [Lentinus tigrinus ALCF2SS1-7]
MEQIVDDPYHDPLKRPPNMAIPKSFNMKVERHLDFTNHPASRKTTRRTTTTSSSSRTPVRSLHPSTCLRLYQPTFFFHPMARPQSFTNTAVTTVETTYLQLRLITILNNVHVYYHNSLSNSQDDLIQFVYAEDGTDNTFLESLSLRTLPTPTVTITTSDEPSSAPRSALWGPSPAPLLNLPPYQRFRSPLSPPSDHSPLSRTRCRPSASTGEGESTSNYPIPLTPYTNPPADRSSSAAKATSKQPRENATLLFHTHVRPTSATRKVLELYLLKRGTFGRVLRVVDPKFDQELAQLSKDRHLLRSWIFPRINPPAPHYSPLHTAACYPGRDADLPHRLENANQARTIIYHRPHPQTLQPVDHRPQQKLPPSNHEKTQPCSSTSLVFHIHLRPTSATPTVLGLYHSNRQTFKWILQDIEPNLNQSVAHPPKTRRTLTAQSVQEHATHITLNTFHHYGRASHKNSTLHAPHLKEIVHFDRHIKTSPLPIYLEPEIAIHVMHANNPQHELLATYSPYSHEDLIYIPHPSSTIIRDDGDFV